MFDHNEIYFLAGINLKSAKSNQRCAINPLQQLKEQETAKRNRSFKHQQRQGETMLFVLYQWLKLWKPSTETFQGVLL